MDIHAVWNFADPGESEQRFRELVAKTPQENKLQRATLLTQVARAQGLQGAFESAQVTLDEAQSLAGQEPSEANVRIRLERGRALRSAGDAPSARPFFEAARGAALELQLEGLLVDAMHMLGIVDGGDEGLAWNEQALEIAQASEDPDAIRWQGPLFHNTAMVHLERGEYPRALEIFEAGRAFRAGQGDAQGERIGRWCIGHVQRLMGRVEEAYRLQIALAEELAAGGLEPDGYVHEELGECLLLLGREEEAQQQFALAKKLLSQDK